MSAPLVTVICVCYNHERFVREAVQSVLSQDYPNIEIIAVDDASTDGSAAVIREIARDVPSLTFIQNPDNLGLCKSFNRALSIAKGEFIIDFATDDVMMPNRIRRQVEHFSKLSDGYGVVFTDAVYIDGDGNLLRTHFEYLKKQRLLSKIPEGDVYRNVLSTYFICSPTMMISRKVLDVLGGYDEELSYEDFDFWVRSSRICKYAYLDMVSTKVRRSGNSMSTGWYRKGDQQLHSTYLVCRKAVALNRSPADQDALRQRLHYELRQSVLSENFPEARLFYSLLKETGLATFGSDVVYLIGKLRLPLSGLRRMYHRVRYE